jgi:hypothetical protein
MHDQIKQLGAQSGKWKTGKRATPGGGNFGSKKPKRTCVFCKGDHHAASCTSKHKPEGIACFGCGKPGHKSFECPDKAGGSANAITDATAKKSVAKKSLPVSSGTCPRCHRGDHLEANCRTKACKQCGLLSAHNWNTCDGTAKSFYLCGSTEIEGEKSEGENPQLTTYSSVVKKAMKPRNDTKFVSLGTMNRYSAFDAPYFPISPKQGNDDELDSLCYKKKTEEELVSFALSADDDVWRENLSDSEDVDDEKS